MNINLQYFGGRGSNSGSGQFVRFGAIPEGGRSLNYINARHKGVEFEDLEDESPLKAFNRWKSYGMYEKVGEDDIFEKGVSAFKADAKGMPKLNSLAEANSAAMRTKDAYYKVTGKQVGTGQDGEPIVGNAKGKKVNMTSEKMEKHIVNTLKKNFEKSSGSYDKSGADRISHFVDWETGKETWSYKGYEFEKPKSKRWAKFYI